ncbi:MAG TPA: hypothetical protein VJB15_12535, partial [Rhodothermia bacterium]|nr:hypothetical protein [Rhodothermia bacterium]
MNHTQDDLVADDVLQIGGYNLRSRLLVGTSRFPSPQVLQECLLESGTQMVTVAVRRVNLGDPAG